MKQFRIDIAAGKNRDGNFSLYVHLAGQSAASATAPPGSTTSLSSWKANATARATSCSLAVTPSPTRLRLMAKVISPGVRAISASQIVPVERSVGLALPTPEGAGVIVEAVRLGSENARLRYACFDRERYSGGQSAARGGDERLDRAPSQARRDPR